LFKKLQVLTEQFKNYCLLSGNFEAANRIFGQIEEIYFGILKKEPGNMLVSTHLLFLYETSADLYANLGNFGKAEESYLRALDYLEEKQQASPENTTYVRQQGEIYRMLGRAFYEEGDSEKAAQYAGKALEILRELAGKKPEDLQYQYEISDDFTELGGLFEDIENIECAKECHIQEIKIYRNIHERDPKDEVSEANIAATLDQLGHLYAERGKTETAKQYYKQGLEAYEKLSESYPEDIDHEVGIANTLDYIGRQYSDPDPEIALKYYKKALSIRENVVQTFPDVPIYKEDLIQILGDLESLASGQKQYENAILYRERITELSRQLASENPENFDYKKELALSFKHKGLLYEKAEKSELAKQQYSKSADVFRQVIQDENEKDLMKDLLALDLQKQATILIHEKSYGLAKEYLALLRDYYEDLYEKNPEKPENWKAVCEIRTLSGILHKSMGNYDVAIQIYKSVFSVLNKHPVSDPNNPDYQSMISVLYTQLGIAYHLADEYDKSKEAFEKSIPINAKLLDEEPENFLHMGDAAVTFTEYSKLLTSMGMKKEAEEYIAKADEIKENIMKKFGFDESTIEDGDKKAL
jgi:tetratricopeptide (TPR) repeat protein